MCRHVFPFLGFALALCPTRSLPAENAAAGLIPHAAINRYGLERPWFTQVEVDRARGHVAYLSQHVSTTKSYTVLEVQYDGRTVAFTDQTLDRYGEPIGQAGAEKLAQQAVEDANLALLAEVDRALSAARDKLSGNEQAVQKVDKLLKDLSATPVKDLNGALLAAAQQLAGIPAAQQAVVDLNLAQRSPRQTSLVLPEIVLYVMTDQGMLHALDAETGRTRWTTALGSADHPSEAAGANDAYVAAINGSNLYVLDQSTGKVKWQRVVQGTPGAGPALSERFVFVPTIRGTIEAYPLEDYRQPPWIFQSHGQAIVQPTYTGSNVAWPTDRGHLNVAEANRTGIRYRFETQGAILGEATRLPPNRLLVASIDGFVYCLHENSGAIQWRFSTGEPILASPIAMEDAVYVVTDDGNLYALNAADGLERWPGGHVGGMRMFLAASQDRLYCLNAGGRLTILEAKTGARLGTLPTETLDLAFVNKQTDRVFIGTRHGAIQCLREIRQPWPLMHNGFLEEQAEKKQEAEGKKKKPPVAPAKAATPPAADNPFGTAPPTEGARAAAPPGPADPFGGPAEAPKPGASETAGTDPFGSPPEEPKPGATEPAGADPFSTPPPGGSSP